MLVREDIAGKRAPQSFPEPRNGSFLQPAPAHSTPVRDGRLFGMSVQELFGKIVEVNVRVYRLHGNVELRRTLKVLTQHALNVVLESLARPASP
jgi:hypothetical protein